VGEALVQPDVRPVHRSEAVTEPLVAEFVGEQITVDFAGALVVHRSALGLQGIADADIGDDAAGGAERVAPAASTGMSQSAISRIWRAFGLKPHPVETWKVSTDPLFVDKVRDMVGLYLSPPENALVLALDEKSQLQAIDRTAPILPIMPTTPARMTHDYVRRDTTSLFAAFDIGSGSVIAQHYRRHRHQEFLRFLKLIDAAVPKDLDLHLVLDNYATHKTPKVKEWLIRHPRFHLHFTPTTSSWLNLVERWFAELTNRKLRRSAHRSITELEADVRQWRRLERRPQTLRLDQDRRPDPRHPPPTAHELTTRDTRRSGGPLWAGEGQRPMRKSAPAASRPTSTSRTKRRSLIRPTIFLPVQAPSRVAGVSAIP
jgi:transposase